MSEAGLRRRAQGLSSEPAEDAASTLAIAASCVSSASAAASAEREMVSDCAPDPPTCSAARSNASTVAWATGVGGGAAVGAAASTLPAASAARSNACTVASATGAGGGAAVEAAASTLPAASAARSNACTVASATGVGGGAAVEAAASTPAMTTGCGGSSRAGGSVGPGDGGRLHREMLVSRALQAPAELAPACCSGAADGGVVAGAGVGSVFADCWSSWASAEGSGAALALCSRCSFA